MENINDDKSILNGLKAHFKEFSPEIIETLYQENNKDITKTRDALIENVKLLNLYNKENKKNVNENIEENDEDSEEEKEENSDNGNKIENEKNEEEKVDNKMDDYILNFLIEIAPFNTSEEILQKIEYFNFDIDNVVSSLLGDDSNSNKLEEKDKNKPNKENNHLDNKSNKNSENQRKIKNFDKNKVDEFIKKHKNKKKIDLHGFHLSESMYIVKNKLEEIEKTGKEEKGHNLLLIITGIGKHSKKGRPVLRPNILLYLKNRNYKVDESQPAGIYVYI